MEKSKIVYKNSAKNEFAVNLLIIVIAGLLTFMAAKFCNTGAGHLNEKVAIVIYAIAIAVSYCRIAINAVERILAKKFNADIISTVAILIIFASQKFLVAAIVSLIYALSKNFYELINAHFSDKIIENSDLAPTYIVVNDENEKELSVRELENGDKVRVNKGDYLAFSYSFTNGSGLTKNYKAGKFNACESGIVTVLDVEIFEIDFESTADNFDKSKAEKKADFAVLVYTIAAVFLAVAMCVLKAMNGGFMDALYTFGVYLLFACPVSIDSGNFIAGFFMIKSLKSYGVNVNTNQNIEDLGSVKSICYEEDVALSGDKVDADVVKAVKTAKVVKLNSVYIGKDEDKAEKAVKVGGFNSYKTVTDDEELKDTLSKVAGKNKAVYVSCEKTDDIKNVINFTTSGDNETTVKHKNLFELVKEIKNCRFYKLFLYIRVAIGVVINFLAVGIFASGKLDSLLSNKLLETDAVGEDTIGVMNKILSVFVYDNKLAPWLIAIMHLVLINVLLLFVQLLLNDNKKLR